MRKIGFLSLMAAVAVVAGCVPHEQGVFVAKTVPVEQSFFVNECEIMGRNFWPMMTAEYYNTPGAKPSYPYHNPELTNCTCFADGAVYAYGGRDIPPGAMTGKGSVTWRTVRENYTGKPPEKDAKPLFAAWAGRPVLGVGASKRNYRVMAGEIDLDYADYEKFKKENPNFFAWSMFAELDNDSRTQFGWMCNQEKREKDPAIARMAEAFGTDWTKCDRYGRLAYLKKYFDRKAALYYGDVAMGQAECCGYMIGHNVAAWGVKCVELETTGTTETSDYRWDVMGMFARGAARQFSKYWNWYPALHSCGYTKDLKRWYYCGANYAHYDRQPSDHRPEGGLSASLMNRLYYYAYLAGANIIEPEGRTSFTTYGTYPGPEKLSPRGEDWERFCKFAKANPDRGTAYAHCAILTPFAQMYPGPGGGAPMACVKYEIEDHMVDGIFYSIIPAPKLNHKELARIGVESNNLHNTSLAMSYDVLVPDSPQPREEFLKQLLKYPVAYLAGMYRPEDDITGPLIEYVQRGGTLVLNSIYLDRFPRGWAGVLWDNTEKGFAYNDKGEYEVAELTLAGAVPVMSTPDGRALFTSMKLGRGKVFVTAPKYMTPKWTEGMKSWTAQQHTEFGKIEFELNRKLFTAIQDEIYPVKVDGDCQYGINRTKDGWWFWALNNRGVSKFVDTAEKIDEAQSSEITVDITELCVKSATDLIARSGQPVLSASGRRILRFTIPAGGIKICELR